MYVVGIVGLVPMPRLSTTLIQYYSDLKIKMDAYTTASTYNAPVINNYDIKINYMVLPILPQNYSVILLQ